MPSRKWPLLVFIWAFAFVVPQGSVAGPIPRDFIFCRPVERPVPLLNPFSNLLPASDAFLQLPRTMFHLGGIRLTHITAPPEFQAHDPKVAGTTGIFLQTRLWYQPCRSLFGITL